MYVEFGLFEIEKKLEKLHMIWYTWYSVIGNYLKTKIEMETERYLINYLN